MIYTIIDKAIAYRKIVLLIGICLTTLSVSGHETLKSNSAFASLPLSIALPYVDTVKMCNRIFSFAGEFRSGVVFGTDRFLRGANLQHKAIEYSESFHLKFGFRTSPGSWIDRVFGSPYQGIGWAINRFDNTRELGNPWAVYLFQGGRIDQFSSRFSLWYEWNMGISSNWKHFDRYTNPRNFAIGSKVNAYMNVSFYLNWALSSQLDLRVGLSLTHFSNGNSHEPNGGVNIGSPLIGVNYYLNHSNKRLKSYFGKGLNTYKRRWMYELLFHAGTVRKEIVLSRDPLKSYSTPKFNVRGGAFSVLYAFNHRLRIGGSIDVVHDESRAIKYHMIAKTSQMVMTYPPKEKQISLGLAGRIDYVMPYFTISSGLGYDVIHSGSSTKRFYQKITLKISIYKGSFINIGYRLQNFQHPNFLMIGVGYLFKRDKYPICPK